jgi:methyl-accepting chemotaxis protein
MKTENIKISTALYTLVAIIAGLIALNAITAIRSMDKVNRSTETIYFDRVLPLQQLKAVSDIMMIDIVNTTYDMNHDKLDWATGIVKIRESLTEMDKNWNAFLKTDIRGEEMILTNEAELIKTGAVQAIEELLVIASAENEPSKIELDNFIASTLYTKIDPFIAQLKKLMDINIDIAHQVYIQSENTYKDTILHVITLFSLGMILIISISVYVIRTLGKSLKYTNEVIEEIANGNLKIEIKRQSKDEIGSLLGNINKMKVKLQEVISFITNGSNLVANASAKLNSTARQIAQGASEQASSIQEISASIEEMSGNIQQNLMNARLTEEVSVKTAREISVVEQSSGESMKKIQEIAEKISIIGSISFQTHILALNASIEAARAGQQGKGFGVVAAEVGKLAERSKIAAIEIDKLTQIGVRATGNAEKLLQSIVPDIVSTSRFVQEITAANNEQSIGADQINQGIQELNQVTQQNAAASQELSSHAEELSGKADELLRITEYFQINERRFPENALE